MADNVQITPGSGTTIATDERSVGGLTVQVQRVDEQGATAIANGQIAISNTASNIVAARETRKRLIIVNKQTVPVYVGVATVTTSNGLRMDVDGVLTLYTTAAVQGITSASYSPVGDAKIHYIEEYDA